MTDFLYLDPFVDDAVHELDIWGEEEGRFQDVTGIHTEAFDTLWSDLLAVSKHPQHRTKVRFLVGMAGSGKSHLFSRLRRRLGEAAVFAFASNPPTRSAALLPWTLEKVVLGLQRPRLVEGVVKPYSQLEALLYQEGVGLEPGSIDGVHRYLSGLSDDGRRVFVEKIHHKLVARGYDTQTLLGMLGVLRPEHRDAAFRWLSGSTNLLDEELHALGQERPIEEGEAERLLVRIGRLSAVAGAPLVLVLDQLDLMTGKEQIDEIQRLLMALINESSNWYVVLGLIQDKLEQWRPHLTDALHSRIRTRDKQLPVIELQHLTDPAHKEGIVRQRLSTPALERARLDSGYPGDTFPLTDEDCRELSAGPEAILPRDLLQLASARYVGRVAGAHEEPSEEPLEARLHLEYRQRREAIDPDQVAVEKASLADRVSEATELLAIAKGLGVVVSKPGPLEEDPRFKGTDTAIGVGGRTLRVVGHHVHWGASFPSFLAKVADLPRGSLLVRDASAGISGKRTTERLAAFQAAGNRFLHLPRPALADLLAMGEVLAEMREGNFARLQTTPPPTEANVKAALATLPWVTGGPLALALLDLLQPKPGTGVAEPGEAAPPDEGEAPYDARPEEGAAPALAPATLAAAVETLLRPARWLMFERLRLWLGRQHAEIPIADLRAALETAPLAASVLRYPRSVAEPSDVQILIWNDDDA